ncbi:MAG: dimethylargininase [Proteobacteria bacterium]|nr:dimethylargininase [Pseudomonadota bacterium]
MADACELTFMDRAPIAMDAAMAQHAAYAGALAAAGLAVEVLPALDGHADCAFIEDCLVLVPEARLAVACRPGAASRQGEVASAVAALGPGWYHAAIAAPGALEGGDVLRIGQRLYVGRTTRTNEAGIAQLAALVAPHGLEVVAVPVRGSLHLKTAVTALAPGLLVGNRGWLDPAPFGAAEWIETHADEPFAGNTLSAGGRVILPAEHRHMAAAIAARGFTVVPVEIGEFAKAEAGVTCLSVLAA